MAKVLCVTAFKDIQRGSWSGQHSEWKRTNDEYINWFENLIKSPIDIICFCDESIAKVIHEKTGFTKLYPYCDDDTFFRHIEQERNIMNSIEYKNALVHRIRHPEHSIPEYNMVQHSKTSFVRRAAEMFPKYSHIAWVDFGYIRESSKIPKIVEWDNIVNDSINYACFHSLDPSHIPEQLNMCIHAPSILQGSMFVLPRHLAFWYEKKYEEILFEYHRLNLADDDQALALQVFKKYPDKFKFHIIPDWFNIFNTLLKPST